MLMIEHFTIISPAQRPKNMNFNTKIKYEYQNLYMIYIYYYNIYIVPIIRRRRKFWYYIYISVRSPWPDIMVRKKCSQIDLVMSWKNSVPGNKCFPGV